MSNVSLSKNIRSCQVYTGAANRIQSDRFLTPERMVCVPWRGFNSKGQRVQRDTFWTKTAGCNSALDRLHVENQLRPQYLDFVTLNAAGIKGNTCHGNVSNKTDSINHRRNMAENNEMTGNFGKQWTANTKYHGCTDMAYERAMSQLDAQKRNQTWETQAYRSSEDRGFCGF
jgi:hypothetical protein